METSYNYLQLDFSYLFFDVGDKVEVLKPMVESPSDCAPGGILAKTGEMVIIKKIASLEEQFTYPYLREWPFAVAHECVSDGSSFRIGAHEIAPWIGHSPALKKLEEKRKEEIDYYGYSFDDLFRI